MANTLAQPEIEPGYLTPAELCDRWKLSLMTLWRMREKGKLKAYKFGERGVRFAISDVLRIEKQSAA